MTKKEFMVYSAKNAKIKWNKIKLQFPLKVYVAGMDSDIDCYYNFYLEKQDIADHEFQEEFVINNLIEFIKVDWFDYLLYGYEAIETNAGEFLSNFVIGE